MQLKDMKKKSQIDKSKINSTFYMKDIPDTNDKRIRIK